MTSRLLLLFAAGAAFFVQPARAELTKADQIMLRTVDSEQARTQRFLQRIVDAGRL